MVDLVKIRRKAKEKKAADSTAEQVQTPPPPADDASRTETAEVSLIDAPTTEPEPGEELNVSASKSRKVTAAARRKLDTFKKTAGVLADVEAEQSEGEKEETEDVVRKLLTFQLGGEQYAIDIDNIIEITPPRATTRVPNADQDVIGIMSLRGTIVTVLDLRRKLGHPPSVEQGADTRIVVADVSGQLSGFFVDRVLRVIKVDSGDLESQPVVSSAEQSVFVSGVFQHTSGLSILLNVERLLSS